MAIISANEIIKNKFLNTPKKWKKVDLVLKHACIHLSSSQ